MAGGAAEEEYECPNCHAPVSPDWKACPACGVEFAGPEEEPAPQAPQSPAPPAAAAPEAPSPAPAPPPATQAAAAASPKSAAATKKATAAKAGPAPASPKPAPPPPKPKSPRKERSGKGIPFLAPITGRFGLVGLIGLPVAVFGLAGFFAMMNYDTLFAGQSVNTIGPIQMNAMLGAVAVAGVGVFLTIFGLIKARSPSQREATELAEAEAPGETAASEARPAAPPPRVQVPDIPESDTRIYAAPEPEARAAPLPAPAAPPLGPLAPAAAEAAAEERDEEEEEGEIELPPAPAATVKAAAAPAEPSLAPAPAPAASPPAATSAAPAAAPAAERDELEDLFGELESEVAKAEEDEVHYECPNCHGIVREDDASCPHCGVTFEG